MRILLILSLALASCGTPAPAPEPTETIEVEARVASEMLLLNWGDVTYVGDKDEPPGRTLEEAHELADRLLKEVREEPDRWPQLLQTYSDSPMATTGGRVESWPLAQLPKDFHSIGEVEVGGFTEVLDAHVGVVILRRVEPFSEPTLSARRLVVSHKGAKRAPVGVERTSEEAATRAKTLHETAVADPGAFEALIKAESDGFHAERGGFMGTWTVETSRYSLITELTIEATAMGGFSAPLKSEFGYEIYQRLEPEPAAIQLSGSHILISHRDATSSRHKRSREEAKALAAELTAKARENVRDFGTLATANSDDGSAEKGGDLGAWRLGKLPAPLEKAFLSIHFDEVTGPIESEYGYHVLHRRHSPADRGLQYRSPGGDPSTEEEMPEGAEFGILDVDREQMEAHGEHDEHDGHNH